MVSTATGQRHCVVSRVVKESKYGHDSVIIPLGDMAETVAKRGRVAKLEHVNWKLVQVRSVSNG
jgi:hypothetical protein